MDSRATFRIDMILDRDSSTIPTKVLISMSFRLPRQTDRSSNHLKNSRYGGFCTLGVLLAGVLIRALVFGVQKLPCRIVPGGAMSLL